MLIQKIGKRWINLVNLVEVERLDGDIARVTMTAGKEFDEPGPDALKLFERLDELAANPFPGMSVSVIPGRGADSRPAPPTARERGA